jgi:hypothetical protein
MEEETDLNLQALLLLLRTHPHMENALPATETITSAIRKPCRTGEFAIATMR